MKRTKISYLTPEQASDELMFMEFEKILKSAKRKALVAQEAQDAVFRALADMCIDAESVPSDAENATNLEQAISCYLDYDEYSLSGIMREVRNAYGKQEEGE